MKPLIDQVEWALRLLRGTLEGWKRGTKSWNEVVGVQWMAYRRGATEEQVAKVFQEKC